MKCEHLKTFLLLPAGFERVLQIFEVFFLLLISSSFLLITHSLFGDVEIGISFVCVPAVDSFSMWTWKFPNLCALLYSSVPTLCSSSLRMFTDHRLAGLGKLCETRTDRFQVFLKILFVYRPAFSFVNTHELEMAEKMCRKVMHSYPQQLIHDPSWATLVFVEGKASLIFREYLNTRR